MLINKLTRSRYVFLFLLALSVTVRIGTSLTILEPRSAPNLLDMDEQEYYQLAGNWLQGEYEFNARRPLGHVLVLVCYRLVTFDNFLATQLLASFLFSITAPLAYLLVRRITGNQLLAAIVGVLIIFWTPFLYYGNSLYSETTALPLFTAFLLVLPRGSLLTEQPEGSRSRWMLCGTLLGLCMLIRPMYLLFTPFAGLIVLLEEQHWHLALRRIGLFAAGCCLIVFPWSIYMTANAGVPILVSANGGETIAGGLNPNLAKNGFQVVTAPDGRQTWSGPGKWVGISETGYLSKAELKLPYAQQDGLLRQRTAEWIRQNPGSALYLQAAKLLYMWGFFPLRFDKQTILGSIPTLAALVLSIAALIRFRQYTRQLARFWLLPIFVSGVALVSWGSWRFRQPGDLGLLVLSALFVLSLLVNSSNLLPFQRLKQPEDAIPVSAHTP